MRILRLGGAWLHPRYVIKFELKTLSHHHHAGWLVALGAAFVGNWWQYWGQKDAANLTDGGDLGERGWGSFWLWGLFSHLRFWGGIFSEAPRELGCDSKPVTGCRLSFAGVD